MSQKKFMLRFRMAAGDVTMLTALVRDIKLTYGDKYLIDVDTNYPALWHNNPYLTKMARNTVGLVSLDFNSRGTYRSSLGRARRGYHEHFVTAFHREFARLTGIRVPCTAPKPDIHISEEEKKSPMVSGRYWVIVPGGKSDMTTKIWPQHRYQEVVNRLRPLGLRFVQEGATHKSEHMHTQLDNALCLLGQTSVRDLIVNVYHAEGVVCGITFMMHLAAALDKPCVVLGGGREDVWWEAYNEFDNFKQFGPAASAVQMPHQYLHTQGLLPCCRKGCWRRRTVPLNDRRKSPEGKLMDGSLCHQPVPIYGGFTPRCMDMITTDHVIEAVMWYYEQGLLPPPARVAGDIAMPPIGKPKNTYADEAVFNAAVQAALRGPTTDPDEFFIPDESMSINESYLPEIVREPELVRPPSIMSDKQTGPAIVHPQHVQLTALENPAVGGRLTVCVYCNDNHIDKHRRCLHSIVSSLPPSKLDLRVLCRNVSTHTMKYLDTLPVSKVYVASGGDSKAALMRSAFSDASLPIGTPWLAWFDDDCYVPAGSRWLQMLSEEIARPGKAPLGMLCHKQMHILQTDGVKDPRDWFRNSPWFKGRGFRTKLGTEAPNGNTIHYPTRGVWVIAKSAIADCLVPDVRVSDDSLEICIGEQLWQGGYELRSIDTQRKLLHVLPVNAAHVTTSYNWYS